MNRSSQELGDRANPVLVRIRRGGATESVHRGAYAVVDANGDVLESSGDIATPIYARSAIKALQALPLIESGAADRYGFAAQELALAISSHNAEECHTGGVLALLERLGLDVDALQCGPQAPSDPAARRALRALGRAPGRVHNNCSGKHTGFLALAHHLAADPAHYLAEDAPVQAAVRAAVGEMCELEPAAIATAIDGCSAPTFRLPLVGMAHAYARLADPARLGGARRGAAERLLDAAATHPVMIAGSHKRLDTDLVRASRGRLFPKVGAEGVYVIAARGRAHGLALKIDDGGQRALHAAVVALCCHLGWLDASAASQLAEYAPGPISNWAGLEVGSTEVVLDPAR